MSASDPRSASAAPALSDERTAVSQALLQLDAAWFAERHRRAQVPGPFASERAAAETATAIQHLLGDVQALLLGHPLDQAGSMSSRGEELIARLRQLILRQEGDPVALTTERQARAAAEAEAERVRRAHSAAEAALAALREEHAGVQAAARRADERARSAEARAQQAESTAQRVEAELLRRTQQDGQQHDERTELRSKVQQLEALLDRTRTIAADDQATRSTLAEELASARVARGEADRRAQQQAEAVRQAEDLAARQHEELVAARAVIVRVQQERAAAEAAAEASAALARSAEAEAQAAEARAVQAAAALSSAHERVVSAERRTSAAEQACLRAVAERQEAVAAQASAESARRALAQEAEDLRHERAARAATFSDETLRALRLERDAAIAELAELRQRLNGLHGVHQQLAGVGASIAAYQQRLDSAAAEAAAREARLREELAAVAGERDDRAHEAAVLRGKLAAHASADAETIALRETIAGLGADLAVAIASGGERERRMQVDLDAARSQAAAAEAACERATDEAAGLKRAVRDAAAAEAQVVELSEIVIRVQREKEDALERLAKATAQRKATAEHGRDRTQERDKDRDKERAAALRHAEAQIGKLGEALAQLRADKERAEAALARARERRRSERGKRSRASSANNADGPAEPSAEVRPLDWMSGGAGGLFRSAQGLGRLVHVSGTGGVRLIIDALVGSPQSVELVAPGGGAQPPGVGFHDPETSSDHVLIADAAGALCDLVRGPDGALSRIALPGPVLPAGARVALAGPPHEVHVFHRGAEAHLHHVAGGGLPQGTDLTALLGLPGLLGDPAAWWWAQEGSLHVVLRAGDGHLHECFSSGGSWGTACLTAQAGGPPPAGDPFAAAPTDCQEVCYAAADGSLHLLRFAGSWQHQAIALPFSAGVGNRLVGDADAQRLVLASTTPDGRIQVALRDASGWRSAIANRAMLNHESAPLAIGDPLIRLHDAVIRLVYLGSDGRLHDLRGGIEGFAHQVIAAW